MQCQHHGQRWHGGNHVTRRSLAGDAENHQPHQQPQPERAFRRRDVRPAFAVKQCLGTGPGQAHHHKPQEPGVFQVDQQLRPNRVVAPQGGVPIALAACHLAGVFAHHKLLPDGGGVRVQRKPEAKHAQGQQRAPSHRRTAAHGMVHAQWLARQQRAPQRGSGRRHQRKGFVQQAQADANAKQAEPQQHGHGAPGAGARQPRWGPGAARWVWRAQLAPQQRPHRQRQPKGLRRRRQVHPPVAKAGKKRQVQDRRQQARAPVAPQALGEPGHGSRGEQRVDHAGQAQRKQRPVRAPVAGHQRLPKQQRRLGVAHVVQVRNERQPLADLGCQACDVDVDHLVAVGGGVKAAQAKKIQAHRQRQQGQPRPQRCEISERVRAFWGWGGGGARHGAVLRLAKSPAVIGQKVAHAGNHDGNHVGQHVVHQVRQPQR